MTRQGHSSDAEAGKSNIPDTLTSLQTHSLHPFPAGIPTYDSLEIPSFKTAMSAGLPGHSGIPTDDSLEFPSFKENMSGLDIKRKLKETLLRRTHQY